jgi:FkbM family methyltransferase
MVFWMPRLERLSFPLGTYEKHIVQCMAKYVRSGMTVYDIGANAGYLTMVLSKLVGPTGRVLAFEPDPKNIAALSLNIQTNRLANVTLLQRAVSDQTGTVSFATFDYSLVGHIAHAHTPSDAQILTVDATKLDDLVYREGFPAPEFIKVDVEGAEDSVIRGSLCVLDRARPMVVIEVRPGRSYEETSAAFRESGYIEKPIKGAPQISTEYYTDLLFVPKTS